jgi:hypothetical protein
VEASAFMPSFLPGASRIDDEIFVVDDDCVDIKNMAALML